MSSVLLISPVRNEGPHIERVVRAVAEQTRPPAEWVVVDDGSEDDTLDQLRALEREVAFMRVVCTPRDYTTDHGDRLAAAAAPRAFNFGLRASSRADHSHLGKLDGDTELPHDYFERLLAEFDRDPSLGIAGGVRLERNGTSWRPLQIPREHVPGALKLYTRACFESIGGMRELLGWDAIDEIYARMHGYSTRSFPELTTRHHRGWGSAEGRLRGRVRYGHSSYVACQGPAWVLLKSLKVASLPPRGISGLAYLYGYFRALARSAPRIEDEAFRGFARRELRARLLRT
jgi:glycosyltransferase involved in cell wall biosynthesis